MLSFSEFTLLLSLLLLGFRLFFSKEKRIPGPWNIPFYSGMFAIGPEPYKTFQQWARKYGPLIRVKLGTKETLIIDDPTLLREAFNDPAFLGRPNIPALNTVGGGKHGINFSDGPEWAEQRRFALRTLRDFGFGKNSMETFIMEEIQEFLKWMKQNEGVPIRIDRRFRLATVNSLWMLLAGERQDHDNKEVDDIIDAVNDVFSRLGQIHHPLTMFPKLIDILPKFLLKEWHYVVDCAASFHKLFADAVENHIKNPADENNPRDLIDIYLTEINHNDNPNSSFYRERGRNTLKIVVGNLYGAGEGTTSSTLTWTILYMIRFPAVQQKLQQELDTVIGKCRLPSLTDRPNLPYTDALTQEIFRYSSHVPFSLPHETMADTRLGGYSIKKGTMVVPNLYSIHYNEGIWGDPQNFRPERFLSADGKTVLRFKELLPFGTGKRQCAGETFARDNYFLFLTSIFQRFEVLPDPENPSPSLEAMHGFLREAQKYKVIIKERQQ